MFAKTALLAALALLPFALAAPPKNGCPFLLRALTVSNFTETSGTGEFPTTHISFDVTDPNPGTAPHTTCSGTVIGLATAASGGSCDDGGSYTLQTPGILTVSSPWTCVPGHPTTLTASGRVPAGCPSSSGGDTCPPFELDLQ